MWTFSTESIQHDQIHRAWRGLDPGTCNVELPILTDLDWLRRWRLHGKILQALLTLVSIPARAFQPITIFYYKNVTQCTFSQVLAWYGNCGTFLRPALLITIWIQDDVTGAFCDFVWTDIDLLSFSVMVYITTSTFDINWFKLFIVCQRILSSTNIIIIITWTAGGTPAFSWNTHWISLGHIWIRNTRIAVTVRY